MDLDKLKQKKNELQEAISMLIEDFEQETNIKAVSLDLNIDSHKNKRFITTIVEIEMQDKAWKIA